MASKILSPREVATKMLETGQSEALILDGEGLYLRLRQRSSGEVQKSWIFIYTSHSGRRRKVTLGQVKDHSLAKARIWASQQRAMLDDLADPLQVRKDAEIEAARNQDRTLGALLDAYTGHLKKLGKTSARDAEGIFKLHISDRLKDLPAVDVRHDDLVAAIRKVTEAGKGRTAGKLRSYLHAAFESAIGAENDARASTDLLGFGLVVNPVSRIKALTEFIVPSERALSRDELRVYVSRIEALPDSNIRDLLRLSLWMGGQRISQLLRGQLGLGPTDERVVIMKDLKGKRRQPRVHILPVVGKTQEIILARGNRLFDLEDEAQVKQDLERASGVVGRISKSMIADGHSSESFRLGDIRRTVETHLASLGVSSDIRAQLQSHGISGIQAKHYDRYKYMSEKKAVLESWELFLREVPTAKVIEIRKKG